MHGYELAVQAAVATQAAQAHEVDAVTHDLLDPIQPDEGLQALLPRLLVIVRTSAPSYVAGQDDPEVLISDLLVAILERASKAELLGTDCVLEHFANIATVALVGAVTVARKEVSCVTKRLLGGLGLLAAAHELEDVEHLVGRVAGEAQYEADARPKPRIGRKESVHRALVPRQDDHRIVAVTLHARNE